ncbi:MAG: GGDEF domain-containing protein [Dehalococcoidia bacterium]
MSDRKSRNLRLVQTGEDEPLITSRGRPRDDRAPIRWSVLLVRLLVLGWAGAICAVLLDETSSLPHVPFLTAMGMTGLLVIVLFMLTHEGVPDWRGDIVEPRRHDDDDDATDLLTELPTFQHFQRRLHDEFVRSRRAGRQVSVVIIDVNNLTAVNKEYGVRAGDEVLRHVAKAAEGTRRYNDVVARLGDDEFGVLLLDSAEDGVSAFIDRLEERLARESAQTEVGGRPISLWAGVCTGFASSVPSIPAAEELLRAAIASLDSAKQERERRRRLWLSA